MVCCMYCGVTGSNFKKNTAFLFPKINFVLANSANPDEVPLTEVFQPDLHCLQKYLFRGFLQRVKWLYYTIWMKNSVDLDQLASSEAS